MTRTRQAPSTEAPDATDAAESSGGSVLGIAQTVVKPPRAAARVPLATVSAVSPPGSRRWACRSHRPGASTSPRPSSRSAAGSAAAEMRPFDHGNVADRIGPVRRVDHSGADHGEGGGRVGQEPEASCGSGDECQHGHPHGDAVLDLPADEAARPVGELGGELDALVGRARGA